MKPTDDTLALVAFLIGGEWLAADEIRHAVKKLGFRMPTSQWVAARLTAMTEEDCPRFQRRDTGLGYFEYRVTPWASNGLANTWPRFSSHVDGACFLSALCSSQHHALCAGKTNAGRPCNCTCHVPRKETS